MIAIIYWEKFRLLVKILKTESEILDQLPFPPRFFKREWMAPLAFELRSTVGRLVLVCRTKAWIAEFSAIPRYVKQLVVLRYLFATGLDELFPVGLH